jgi:hypothetical protein
MAEMVKKERLDIGFCSMVVLLPFFVCPTVISLIKAIKTGFGILNAGV